MKYKVEYLPIAKQDMVEIVNYISHTLNNPNAATRLAEEMVKKADSLSDFPYLCPSYTPIRSLSHDYRKLIVKNYIMFYWVSEESKTITIARVIYAKRDFAALLK